MAKLKHAQREELKQCVTACGIRRLTTNEMQHYIELGIEISYDYLLHLRADLKKDTIKTFEHLHKDKYAYLDELFFDRTKELKSMQKTLHEIIDNEEEDNEIRIKAINQLQSITLQLSNYYALLPKIGIGIGTEMRTETETETGIDAFFSTTKNENNTTTTTTTANTPHTWGSKSKQSRPPTLPPSSTDSQEDTGAVVFSSQRSQFADYTTWKGIENKTGIEREHAYDFVLKELLDNAVDYLETQHNTAATRNSCHHQET